jgi:hypothetical protein
MILSYFQNIRKNIISEIENGHKSISIAVYWFTNQELFDLLLQKLSVGVKIELIIHNDYINNRETGLAFQKFIDQGGKFYFSDEENPMHNKFCIIDNKVLINGSYNWTYYAENKNRENILLIKDEEKVIGDFETEFKRLVSLIKPVNEVRQFTKFEVEENNALKIKDYLVHDMIYQGKETNNYELVKNAFEIAPENLNIQRIANEIGLTKKFKLKHSVGVLIEHNNVRFIAVKGASIPATYTTIVKTSFENQDRIDTDILFGESQKASENKKLVRKMTLNGLPKKPAGETKVKFIFSIDNNGKLRIQMLSLDNGKVEIYQGIHKELIEESSI